jgi:putative phage-type endonuclease
MSYVKIEYPTLEAWLTARHNSITGSDAGAIMGVNKYLPSDSLLKAKTSKLVLSEKKDNKIGGLKSGLGFMEYGKKAELHLRELFILDYYGQYDVEYLGEYTVLQSTDAQHRIASLDGILTDRLDHDNKGVLEIKTVNIFSQKAVEAWEGGAIPDHYYYQILHYLLVTGFNFAILKAQFKSYDDKGQIEARTCHYRLDMEPKIVTDMGRLKDEEDGFYKLILKEKANETIAEDDVTGAQEKDNGKGTDEEGSTDASKNKED